MLFPHWTALQGKFYLLSVVEVFITFNLKEIPTQGLAILQASSAGLDTLKKNLKCTPLLAFVCILKEKRRDQ